MNVIVARRDGPCAACPEQIMQGERIVYERTLGPRHLACADLGATVRRNEHPATCYLCGARVGIGTGALEVVENEQEDGTFERVNQVRCRMGAEECVRRRIEAGDKPVGFMRRKRR